MAFLLTDAMDIPNFSTWRFPAWYHLYCYAKGLNAHIAIPVFGQGRNTLSTDLHYKSSIRSYVATCHAHCMKINGIYMVCYRERWMYFRVGFLAVIWFESFPSPIPPSRSATHRKTDEERQLSDGRGVEPRLVGESRRLAEFSFKHSKADSPSWRVIDSPSLRVADSPSREVVYRLRISPRIRSQNRNSSKGSVRDLWGTNYCKNPPHCHVPLKVYKFELWRAGTTALFLLGS